MININQYIEYTYLNEDVSIEKINEICQTAIENNYFAVCCPNNFVRHAKQFLKGTEIKVVTVISFPKGTSTMKEKLSEAEYSIGEGADEIDMVMNYQLLKAGNSKEVYNEIKQIADLVHLKGMLLKVIIESGILSFEEIASACDICVRAKVDFVKTSTGKVHPGAELDKVKYMRQILAVDTSIKAAGGIKTREQALAFINAGASRIGTSIPIF